MKQFTKQDYDNLQTSLEMVEQKLGLPRWVLGNECVDRQNVLVDGMTEDSPNFWARMFDAAVNAANGRLLDLGINGTNVGN
jgi:hypothetical protein